MAVSGSHTAGVVALVRIGRQADGDAAGAVARLANTARRGGAPAPTDHEGNVRGFLANSDSFLAVAEDAGAVVGMALGMQALDDDGAGPPLPGLCHVAMVFVHPQWWGRGIGKMLIRHLLAEGQDRGYERFQLWTHADNQRAQRLYEGLGFRRSGREKDDDFAERIIHYELRGPGERG